MWVFSTIGVYSIVQKRGTDFLTVRSRVREDLDNLRSKYMPTLSETVENAGTDYKYRATIQHSEFAKGMAELSKSINYDNFKDQIKDPVRKNIFAKVWYALMVLSINEANY